MRRESWLRTCWSRSRRTLLFERKDSFFFIFFITFLIAPSLYMTFFLQKPPWTPRLASHLYDTGNLFPRGVTQIPLFYLQMQTAIDGPWITLDEQKFFPISKGLGHRTRFSRMTDIYLTQDGPICGVIGKLLADWFYPRYPALYPDRPRPVSFRILRAFYQVGSQTKQGGWTQPPIESYSKNNIEIAYANTRP